jgi:hypothetical protein
MIMKGRKEHHYTATLRNTSSHFTELHFATLHHTSPNYTSLHLLTCYWKDQMMEFMLERYVKFMVENEESLQNIISPI